MTPACDGSGGSATRRTGYTPTVRSANGAAFQAVRDEQRRRLGPATTAGTTPPDGRDDLPQVLYLAAPVVLRIYLMASTRCGISAKQLERELGVTYKTAWRMLNKIRNELMNDDGEPLYGEVEVDETAVLAGPRGAQDDQPEAARWREAQVAVLGMVERGGRVQLRLIPSRRGPSRLVEQSGERQSGLDPLSPTTGRPTSRSLASSRPPGHQPLGGNLRRRRRSHEHHRGRLRELEDRDARRLQACLARVAAVLPGRVRVALQLAATTPARCSRRYFLGLSVAEPLSGSAAFLRFPKKFLRFGIGTSRPLGVCSVGFSSAIEPPA